MSRNVIRGLAGRAARIVHRSRLADRQKEIEVIARSELFDRNYYLNLYPDVAASGMDPVEHYVYFGAKEGRNPSGLFNTAYYLENNPEVANAGINPLYHYCESGWKQGLQPTRLHEANEGGEVDEASRANALIEGQKRSRDEIPSVDRRARLVILKSGLFDAGFYCERVPGLVASGIDPVEHYLRNWNKGVPDPSPFFDGKYYLARNKDVSRRGMNPFYHFCAYGWKELRNPSPAYDIVWHWAVDADGDAMSVNPLARSVGMGGASGNGRIKPVGRLTSEEIGRFRAACHEILLEDGVDAKRLRAIGSYAIEHKQWTVAEEVFSSLVSLEPDKLKHRLELANAVDKQGRVWQRIEVLKDALPLAEGDAGLHFLLGDANERMGRFDEAAQSFARAVSLSGGNADWHYRHGHVLEESGRLMDARRAYARATALGRGVQAHRFGVGAFHQSRGKWACAASAYTEALQGNPLDAELHYRRGMALDRCYRWAEAEEAYTLALTLNVLVPYWHYRLGFVLERQGKFCDAAEAYRVAAEMEKEHKPYWFYRAGYCLEAAAEYRLASEQYLRTDAEYCRAESASAGVDQVAVAEHYVRDAAPAGASKRYLDRFCDSTRVDQLLSGGYLSADALHKFAKAREFSSDLDGAIDAYRSAIARSERHMPGWHYRLGFCLAQRERWREACEAFRGMRILKRPFGVDFTKYEKDPLLKSLMEYNEYLETLPIQKNTVLYESYLGASASCNPYAIFCDIVDRPEYAEWWHVWVLNDASSIPEQFKARANLIFIPRSSDAYRRYLATAEYLVNNVTFPYWFIRRDGQKYLNTWHGTPLKCLGKDMKNEAFVHGNVTRNLLHATHVISPNRHTSDVMMRSYEVGGVFGGKLAETGYPRIDSVLRTSQASRQALLRKMGLSVGKPVVLYAPTWRGIQGRPETDRDRLVSDITAMSREGYQFIFRGHHFMESALGGLDDLVTTVPHDIDTCELLSVVDALITDYSSILFDFLPTRRPIVYYAYDKDEYAAGRGMYFSVDDLPGVVVTESERVGDEVLRLLADGTGNDGKYDNFVASFCSHENGEATRRTVAFFFHEVDEHVVDRYEDHRKSVLFYNGMFPANGITSSCLNLLKGLVNEDLQVSMLFEPAKIRIDPIRTQKFESMPASVKRIAREGRMVMSPEEIWISARFESQRYLDCDEMYEIMFRGYGREFGRITGGMRIDAVVNFEGYNALTSTIMAAAPGRVRKAMYMHNDMLGERNVKLPYLDRIFNLYGRYDCLVSVSRLMCQVNQGNLSDRMAIDAGKFISCDNTIDVEEILQKANEPLDDDLHPWFGNGETFITLGRMSPEKDHAKLIRAFSLVVAERPKAKLVILGDGPLRQELMGLIAALDLKGSVKLAGLRMNPFPALKAADCFVLPSNHEGQPMVLLEAMTLGKPIIATDIDGSRGVIESRYGVLVQNDSDALAAGLLEFLARGARASNFNALAYQELALREFKNVVLEI